MITLTRAYHNKVLASRIRMNSNMRSSLLDPGLDALTSKEQRLRILAAARKLIL